MIPELKHPAYFAAIGLPMEDAFVAVLEAEGWAGPDAPLVVQCFEVEPLRRLNARIDAPLVQLIAAGSGPWDRPDLTPAAMLSPEGLAEIAAYADILGLESGLVIAHDSGTPTGVVETPMRRAFRFTSGPCAPRTTSCRRLISAATTRPPMAICTPGLARSMTQAWTASSATFPV